MYQVLARKWRPKNFASLKGQTHVTQALTNALTSQKLHHAYLFTGTRGVGKTSIARILAKALNCETGITATPCGVCQACQAIDNGSFVDLIEVDAASRTRVEDTRELLENVQYAPTQGRFKIYLIDEVHMLSTHSFNALLKTLEEPPAHVKFILATTDPDRIPMTILSRCLRLSLKALSVNDLSAQCAEILQEANYHFDQASLRKIANAADGSMRDALSLLEQAIAYGNGGIEEHAVDEMLGMSYQRYMPELLQALSALDVKQSLQVIEKMHEVAADFSQVLNSLLQTLHALAIAQAVPAADPELALLADIAPELLGFKDKFTPEDIQLLYQIALNGQRDLPYAPCTRSGFEMTVLRMIVFNPVSVAVPVERAVMPAVVKSTPAPTPVAVKPAPAPVAVAPAPVAVAPAPVVAPVAPAPVALAMTAHDSKELDWPVVSNALELAGFAKMIVKNSIVSKWDGKQLQLTLDSTQKACLNPQRQAQIEEALCKYVGATIKLTIILGDVQTQSPIIQEKIAVQEKHEQANKELHDDQRVKSLLDTFNATIEKVTLQETTTDK